MIPNTNPYEQLTAVRIIDVNTNRASEGMRVVEEYCRFVLSDAGLTARCKALRDDLHKAIDPVSRAERLLARDTINDVGASVIFGETFGREVSLFSLEQIAAKNGERVKEALRVIEEYCKTYYPEVARPVGMLRYRWYTIEKDCQLRIEHSAALAAAQLYALTDGGESPPAFVQRVQSLLIGGVHLIQLRDKRLDDRTLLARARLLRQTIDDSSARPLMIVNDRPDVALLAQADGVHVGQDELSVHDVRRIVGSHLLIGVSTHTIEQARQAVLDGANYLGCGPTFPSGTKHFDHFPGLDFLRQVAAEISLPAFAIGGITTENLPDVLAAGFNRIAVSGAITTTTTDNAKKAKSFLAALEQAPNNEQKITKETKEGPVAAR